MSIYNQQTQPNYWDIIITREVKMILCFIPWLGLPKFTPGHFWLLKFRNSYHEKQKISDSESICLKGGFYLYKEHDFVYTHTIVCRIDATNAYGRLCRLVNDAPQGSPVCNAKMKLVHVNCCPSLLLFATRDIGVGEEIAYDYGAAEEAWWREVSVYLLLTWYLYIWYGPSRDTDSNSSIFGHYKITPVSWHWSLYQSGPLAVTCR